MISAWWLLSMLPAFLLGMFVAGMLSDIKIRDGAERSYFEGLKKGHNDMNERFHTLIRERDKSK